MQKGYVLCITLNCIWWGSSYGDFWSVWNDPFIGITLRFTLTQNKLPSRRGEGGCKIHRLLLCGEVWPSHNECSGYETRQCDGEAPLILELWGMWSTPLLPSLPGPLWPGVVAPERVLFMGQIELNCILMLNWLFEIELFLTWKLCTYAKLNCLKWNCFCIKMDLALNNQQWLMFHKTKPNPFMSQRDLFTDYLY